MGSFKQIIWPCTLIILAGIFSFTAYRIANHSALADLLRGVSSASEKIGKFLVPLEVTENFHSYIQSHAQSRKLVLVSETRIASSSKVIKIGPSTANLDISAPVEYNYYVDLGDNWNLKLENGILKVKAPRLLPMTPAVSVSGMKENIKGGWLVFGENNAMQELKKDFESELKSKAMSDKTHAVQIYDTARLSLAKLISTWLDNGMLKDYPVKEISVSFEGEETQPTFNIIPQKRSRH